MPKRDPDWHRLDPGRLRQLRRARGISARQLSLRIGMSNSYISQVERGSYLPSAERTRQIARVLKTTVKSISTKASA